MDMFVYAYKVRLRSSQNNKYLAADGTTSVFQSKNKKNKNQEEDNLVWEVKQFSDKRSVIRLRSIYGGYLTGSRHNFLLGWTGKKVVQTNPTKADDLSEWEPVHAENHGTLIKLRTREGTYLRANGGSPPWRNSVTHDHQEDHQHNLLWEVEVVQEKDYSDALLNS